MTRIYVGNLPFSADEAAVRQLFEQHGTVESVALINDRETGRPRGFGFVEMPRPDAQRAIQSLNGKDMGGRPLRVNEAQERQGGGGGGGWWPRSPWRRWWRWRWRRRTLVSAPTLSKAKRRPRGAQAPRGFSFSALYPRGCQRSDALISRFAAQTLHRFGAITM
jgi:RNA recognition motif-containing protein